MAKLTRKQAEYLVAAGAAVDFLTGQRISTPIARRINAALRRAAPTVGRSQSIADPASVLPARDPISVLGLKKPKRRRSSYNKAVSSAMKAVKKSKFMGKPGKFSSPKKAFATVNRTVSKIKKGAKVGTKGVSGVIKRAVRRIL
jgi:hypothetical protein